MASVADGAGVARVMPSMQEQEVAAQRRATRVPGTAYEKTIHHLKQEQH